MTNQYSFGFLAVVLPNTQLHTYQLTFEKKQQSWPTVMEYLYDYTRIVLTGVCTKACRVKAY